jgi:Tfp pilus assembly protein PilF
MKKTTGRIPGSEILLQFALFGSLAVYIQTINFSFVYDDFAIIVLNRWLASWHGLTQMFLNHSWAFSDNYSPPRHYRPIFLVWLWVVQHVFSPSPGWFHLCTIFIHLLAVALAYLLAKRLLKDSLSAAMAALLFAAHPTKVESVAWIAAGTEPLMAAFFFAAILGYIRARESTRHGWVWMLASFLCALAALLTKETAAVLPGILLAYELLFARPGENKPRFLRLAGWLSPYVLADAIWLGARFIVLHGAGEAAIPASMKSTLLTAPVAFWLYVRQLLWPVNLSALYPKTAVNQISVSQTLVPVAGLLVLGAAYWAWARRSAVLKFGAIWFLLTLTPTIVGFAWIQLHDRHLYLPSFAVALAAAVAVRQVRWPSFGLASREHVQVAATLAIAVVMLAMSANETRFWSSELALFTRAAALSPANPEAVEMLAHAEGDSGQQQLALATLTQGLQKQPDSARLTFALGTFYFGKGDYAHARPLLERVTRAANPDYRATALYDLSVIEMGENHRDIAESLLRAAIDTAPGVDGYRRALANLQASNPVHAY